MVVASIYYEVPVYKSTCGLHALLLEFLWSLGLLTRSGRSFNSASCVAALSGFKFPPPAMTEEPFCTSEVLHPTLQE